VKQGNHIKERVIDALEKIRTNMVDLDEQGEEFNFQAVMDQEKVLRNEADYQDFENIELCSSLNESIVGDDFTTDDEFRRERSKSRKSGKKNGGEKKMLKETLKRNTSVGFESLDVETSMRPMTTSKEILDGMKKRIIFDELHLNDTNAKSLFTPQNTNNPTTDTVYYDSIGTKSTAIGGETPNEKGHFISMDHLRSNSNKNIRFTNYATARVTNEVEYNQLLECLRTFFFSFIFDYYTILELSSIFI
jgi:hypothetical protein